MIGHQSMGSRMKMAQAMSTFDMRRSAGPFYAAAGVQKEWAATPPRERGEILRRAFVAITARAEEFALLISGDAQSGLELAERVRRAIETTAVELRGGEAVYVTASAGVATYRRGSHDETLLIEQADLALYESKRNGRNRVTVHPSAELPEDLTATLSA